MDLTSASKVILRSNISAAQVDENYSNYNDTVSVKGTAGMMEYIIRALVGKKEEDHNENKESQQNVEESKETIAIANDLKSTAAEFFAKVDSIFSEHIPDSEISRINSSKSLEEIFTLSQPLGAVLSFALKVSQKTRGLFDPAVGPLCKHLKEQLGDNDASSSATATPPPPTVFKNAFVLRQTGNGYTLQKLHPLSKITLCGISKGWAVDELSAIVMEKFKLKGVFVSWAGDIRVRGLLYQGAPNRKWPVTVHEPTATSTEENLESQPIITTILLQAPSNKAQSSPSAIATSGNQFQGEHIYNPATGSSKTTVHQSTIVAQSCMIADALAKVGIVSQTIPAARRLLESLRNDPVVCVEDFILYTAPSAATSGIPLITRMQIPGIELPEHREIRKTKHNNGAHVIVVGAGLAGLSAAVEAAEWGANVTIIEKESRVGGNSAKATSGINAWGTPAQVNNSILDDERYFERDTFLSGKGGHCDHSLVRTLSTQSANAVKWLSTKFDIDLSVVSQLGGHSQPRTHRIPAKSDGKPVPVGYTIISHIKAYIDAHLSDKIKILTSCSVKELILTPESKMTRARRSISPALVSKKSRPTSETKDEVQPYKEVIGVTYINNITGEEIELKADATVLCTGGFCADHTSDSLLNEFRPDLLKVPTTNGGFATGDGMKICRKIGASLLDMEKIQLHPTGFIDPNDPWNVTKYLAPEAIRGSGGILVNQNGKRFINELDLRSVVAAAIQNHCESYKSDVELPEDKAKNVLSEQKFAWCILSTEAQVKFGTPTLNFYKDSLKLVDGPFYSIAEVAKFIKVDEEVLLHTVKDYQLSAANGICATTKKTVFPAKFTLNADETYVVARVTPSLHYSMGGVEISPSGEVQERLSSSEQIFGRRRHIKRLLAAGEVTGGVHGENRLGGNSLLECVVFGRIAGERAATINTKEQNCLTLKGNDWNPCVLREMRITDDLYGLTTRTLRFNMHGMIQSSGLRVGQFLGVRGELDGETLVGWFSPITRPGDLGVVGILTRTDEKGGAISNLLTRLRPGSSCYLKIMGGLELDYIKEDIVSMICFNKGGRHVKRLGMLAGGTGIAPMVQLVRAYIRFVLDDVEETEREISLSSEGRRLLEQKSKAAASSATGDDEEGAASALVSLEEEEESTPPLNLIYAAETSPELAFVKIMTQIQEQHPDLFRFYIVLNQPPLGWTEGIGFITADIIKEHMFYPPKKDDLVVICGPPIFEQIMGKTLTDALKFERDAWYSFSQG